MALSNIFNPPQEKRLGYFIQLIGVFFFGFLFCLAWYYYKERMLSFDPAFFSFRIIDDENFDVELGRWGSVISQWLPILALKQSCSLETFLRLYSVSFIISYYIVFLIITFGLKNYKAAIGLMIALCLTFRHSFYYATGELYQGIALTILLWAIMSPEKNYSDKQKWIAAAISCVLIYVISYFHQLTFFTVFFVLFFEFLYNKRYKDFPLISVIVFALIWYIIRIKFLTTTEYEKSKMIDLQLISDQLPRLRELPCYIYFKQFAKQYLIWFALVMCIVALWLLKKRNWLSLLFIGAFPVGYLALIFIIYHNGDSPVMYENYFTSLGLFAGVGIVSLAYERIKQKQWLLIVLCFVLVFNLKQVNGSHHVFTKRIEYIQRLTDHGRKQEKKKFLLDPGNFQWKYGWVAWTLPFETALYSSIAGPDSAITIYVVEHNKEQIDTLKDRENIFLGPEWAVTWFGSQNLDKRYFNFPSSGYESLNTSQSDSAFDETVFNNKNLSISALTESISSDTDPYVVIPVKIINTSGKKLASLQREENGIFLCYKIYDSKGNIVLEQGERTVLEVDVLKEYIQGVTVNLPEASGDYTVEIDFITENKRWWGIKSTCKLTVN